MIDSISVVDNRNCFINIHDLGYIEIPVISLKAPINKGVDLNTLKSAVGHFENTSFDYGNIGLAAHNRRI